MESDLESFTNKIAYRDANYSSAIMREDRNVEVGSYCLDHHVISEFTTCSLPILATTDLGREK